MKPSKIVLFSFFTLCLIISLFYTVKIIGAEKGAKFVEDYKSRNFDRQINTIVIEDGWNVYAYVGNQASDISGRYRNFHLAPDSLERDALADAGINGLVMSRYIPEFDDRILDKVEVRGDSLIFRKLGLSITTGLDFGRLRINLSNIENVQLKGNGRLYLTGSHKNAAVRLSKMNVSLEDEGYARLNNIWFGHFNLNASDRSHMSLTMINSYLVDNGSHIADIYPDDQKWVSSSIKLTGNSKMTVRLNKTEFPSAVLEDEAYVFFTGDATVITKDGLKSGGSDTPFKNQ